MNAEVMIEDFCTEGQVPNYSGTDLPSWITLDIVNNRIIGAAGTYAGTSQPAANATALAALFQAVAQLGITCVDVGFDCTPFTPHFSWPQTGADTNEIWRNQNGAGYLLADTIAGGITVWTDTVPVPSGEIWCYKTRGVVGGTPGAYSTERCAGNDFVLLGIGAVSYPTLMVEYGDMLVDDPTAVTSLDLSELKCVSGNAYFDSLATLATIDLSNLVSVGADLDFDQSTMAALNLPLLTTVGGDIQCNSCPNLTTVSIPLLVFQNGQTANFDNCALNVASVNHILARAVASAVTTLTLRLDNGTNATPAGQGATDLAALLLAGNTVTTN